jgi:hypothetical protein
MTSLKIVTLFRLLPSEDPPDVVTGAEHVGTIIWSVSPVVIVPLSSDIALPVHVVLSPTVMALLLSMSVPMNVVLAASVVAAVAVQKTLQADAPLDNVITEPASEVRAPSALKIYVPLPFRVTLPPTSMAPVLQYTPGV